MPTTTTSQTATAAPPDAGLAKRRALQDQIIEVSRKLDRLYAEIRAVEDEDARLLKELERLDDRS